MLCERRGHPMPAQVSLRAGLVDMVRASLISVDGQATWFKRVQFLAVYLIIAESVYWMPVVEP